MTKSELEKILDLTCQQLIAEARATKFTESKQFEQRVRVVLSELIPPGGPVVDLHAAAQTFPDIALNDLGVEVKFTQEDTWLSIANSISERSRVESVEFIYILFGKMGGTPDVKWEPYEQAVKHVRTSHVPRFEIEMTADGATPRPSLFAEFEISYTDFAKLPMEEKMKYIRAYGRKYRRKGEYLWWLEEKEEENHSLGLHLRIYTSLTEAEKIQCRAEAILLCPEILQGSRARGKYDAAVSYLLTYRGVLCHQARDLFSAGSVALAEDDTRGGLYIQRSLKNIQLAILRAAKELDSRLFVEYWGKNVLPEERIKEWLKRADYFAVSWKPSEHLFVHGD